MCEGIDGIETIIYKRVGEERIAVTIVERLWGELAKHNKIHKDKNESYINIEQDILVQDSYHQNFTPLKRIYMNMEESLWYKLIPENGEVMYLPSKQKLFAKQNNKKRKTVAIPVEKLETVSLLAKATFYSNKETFYTIKHVQSLGTIRRCKYRLETMSGSYDFSGLQTS